MDFVTRTMTDPADAGATFFLVSVWLDSRALRQELRNLPDMRWQRLWHGRLETDDARHLVEKLRSALTSQIFTEDLGYAADVVRRIATGTLAVVGEQADDVRKQAHDVGGGAIGRGRCRDRVAQSRSDPGALFAIAILRTRRTHRPFTRRRSSEYGLGDDAKGGIEKPVVVGVHSHAVN